jgi:hypothetical protein
MHDQKRHLAHDAHRLPAVLVWERIGTRERMRIVEDQLRRLEAQPALALVVAVLGEVPVQRTKIPSCSYKYVVPSWASVNAGSAWNGD